MLISLALFNIGLGKKEVMHHTFNPLNIWLDIVSCMHKNTTQKHVVA